MLSFHALMSFAIIVPAYSSFHGGCSLNGLYLPNGTLWKPEPCQQCQCISAVSICEPVQCHLHHCPTSEGYQLVALPHECCPKCLPRFNSCFENGREILHGSIWKPSVCVECQCYNGSVSCTSKECNFRGCQDGHVAIHGSEDCCPTCVSTGRSCQSGKKLYKDGETWIPISCVRCQCINGVENCYMVQCSPLTCSRNYTLVSQAGDCCPTCQGNACLDNDVIYQSGQIWKKDSCTHCVCSAGVLSCHRKICPNIRCSEDQIIYQPEGQCCPSCVLKNGFCTKDEKMLPHGITYQSDNLHCNETSKELCFCNEGSIQCESVLCQKATCGRGKKLRANSNSCECDKCVPDLEICFSEGVTRHDGDVWKIECDVCECSKGKINCFSPICPLCPSGFVHSSDSQLLIDADKNCCPPCRAVKCPETCASCVSAASQISDVNRAQETTCSSCRRGFHLQEGTCVSECKDGYFSRPGICITCHFSCKTCTDATKFHCNSCLQPYVLQGSTCVMKCNEGFFAKEGKCQTCYANCKECSGPLSNECLTCPADRRLFNGTCVQCPMGYMQKDTECHGCPSNCLLCDTKNCLKCKNGYQEQNGICVINCTEGYYSKSNRCLQCESNCKLCKSFKCVECQTPSLLENGTCVMTCSSKYLRHENENYCHYNAHVPVLFTTGAFVVSLGGFTEINSSTVKIYDPETATNLLSFIVEKPPYNGDLILHREFEETLTTGHTFKVEDIENGLVYYKHKYNLPHSDTLQLSAFDGNFKSESYDISINIISKYPPILNYLEPLIVRRGGKTAISEDNVQISDVDNLDSVNLYILDGPFFGLVLVRGKPAEKFSLSELQELAVTYESISSFSEDKDRIAMQANDGFNAVNFLIDIIIVDEKHPGPKIIRNKMLKVKNTDQAQITSNILKAKSVVAGAANLIYELIEGKKSKEGHIAIVKQIPSVENGFLSDGWVQMDETHVLMPTLSFTQQDIDDGKIWYVHSPLKGNVDTNSITEKVALDNITFSVSDANYSTNTLDHQLFVVQIEQDTQSKEKYKEEFSMTVLEGQAVTLTADHLPIVTADLNDDLVYTITRPLGIDDGFLFHIDSPGLELHQFTQSDIRDMKLIYMPPLGVMGDQEKDISFKFTISRGSFGKLEDLGEHKLSIKIKPSASKQIYFVTPVFEISLLTGQSATLDKSLFELLGEESETVSILLLQKPNHGMLFVIRDQSALSPQIFTEETKMNVKHIKAATLKYVHNGSSSQTDSITFLAVAKNSEATLTINFKIEQNDVVKPEPHSGSSFVLELKEGASTIIPTEVLHFTDLISQDFIYSLTTKPVLGSILITDDYGITRSLDKNDKFTLDDASNGRVTFVSDKEIGFVKQQEKIVFKVTNLSNNTLPNQILNVKIEPVDNIGPKIIIHKDVEIMEGGLANVGENVLSVLDPDTKAEDIKIFIITPPIFGYIYSSQQMEEKLPKTVLAMIKFNLDDLLEGRILYNQTQHKFQEPKTDSFHVQASDGKQVSAVEKIVVNIQLINDEAPVILGEQVILEVGGTVALKNTSLFISDGDTMPSNLLIQVQKPPKHGTLHRKGMPTSTIKESYFMKRFNFTFEDVQSEVIIYSHDGTVEKEDEMEITVSDGKHKTGGVIQFLIFPSSTKTPQLIVNIGLTVRRNHYKIIQQSELMATDEDSVENNVKYIITMPTTAGSLQFYEEDIGTWKDLNVGSIFTQKNINENHIRYYHTKEDELFDEMHFYVQDLDGNVLLDQIFNVFIVDDTSSIKITENLTVRSLQSVQISLDRLDIKTIETDIFKVIKPPLFGVLENKKDFGNNINSWTVKDFMEGNIIYVQNEVGNFTEDYFEISIANSLNNSRSVDFRITILPLPKEIFTLPIMARQGMRAFVTEDSIRITGISKNLNFIIIKTPNHGNIEEMHDGKFVSVKQFTLTSLKNLSYIQNGSHDEQDSFTVEVAEFGDKEYLLNGIISRGPFKMEIEIADNVVGSLRNTGLFSLKYSRGKIHNSITANDLNYKRSGKVATEIKYHVIDPPSLGVLKLRNGTKMISHFTQDLINEGLLYYELNAPLSSGTTDEFSFSVGANDFELLEKNTFDISWSYFYIPERKYIVDETDGVVRVRIKRLGNITNSAKVRCQTHDGTAHGRRKKITRGKINHEKQDFVPHSVVIKFESGIKEKYFNISINDDSHYEGKEHFLVRLTSENYSLIGKPRKSTIFISDIQDKPTVQFEMDKKVIKKYTERVLIPVKRIGDLSKSAKVYCIEYEGSLLKSLNLSGLNSLNYVFSEIYFSSGMSEAYCNISLDKIAKNDKISLFTLDENITIGKHSEILVLIDKPHLETTVGFKHRNYTTIESLGRVKLTVERMGNNIDQISSVWIASRELRTGYAKSGEDFKPFSQRIVFDRGQTDASVIIKIYDDKENCSFEGTERFQVFLSTPVNTLIASNSSVADIFISDDEDIPMLQFSQLKATVSNNKTVISATVERNGDINCNVSVSCLLMSNNGIDGPSDDALIMAKSLINFASGIKERECKIFTDFIPKAKKNFLLLSEPFSWKFKPLIGPKRKIPVPAVENDRSVVTFENISYTVVASITRDEIARIPIYRHGDISHSATVKIRTVNLSAIKNRDYEIMNDFLEFPPGRNSLNVLLRIMKLKETRETLTLKLQLVSDNETTESGFVTSTEICIKSENSINSTKFPHPPVIISIADLHSETLSHTVPKDYPLLCISPCDIKHANYHSSKTPCETYGPKDMSSTIYYWEVTSVVSNETRFNQVMDRHVSSSSNFLDTSLFGLNSIIRCRATFISSSGDHVEAGRSEAVVVNDIPLCSIRDNKPHENFTAILEHVQISDNASRLKLRLIVLHYDGTVPLFSSKSIANLQLRSNSRLQSKSSHSCSNLDLVKTLFQSKSEGHSDKNMLNLDQGLLLYEHLNMDKCEWSFSYFYNISHLTTNCDVTMKSVLQNESTQRKVTVNLPLYLTYVDTTKSRDSKRYPIIQTEVSGTYYDSSSTSKSLTILENSMATVEVNLINLDIEGRLAMEFSTKTKFHGKFLESHSNGTHVLSSGISPPKNSSLNFELKLLWSEDSWNETSQVWKARSNFVMDDYSGNYILKLLPCIDSSQQLSSNSMHPNCVVHSRLKFNLPINTTGLKHLVPVTYTLNTQFHLFGDKKNFIVDSKRANHLVGDNYESKFSPSGTVYGRVLWLPEKSWQSSMKLRIEKVYVCTGKSGYVPRYDPEGVIYGGGKQYGCLQNSPRLRNHLLILDRKMHTTGHETSISTNVNAHFIDEDVSFKNKKVTPNMDGFVLKTDQLYLINPKQTWYIQVNYHIGYNVTTYDNPSNTLASVAAHAGQMETGELPIDEVLPTDSQRVVGLSYYINGTNIQTITFSNEDALGRQDSTSKNAIYISVSAVILLLILLSLGFYIQRNYTMKKEKVLVRLKNEQPKNKAPPSEQLPQFCKPQITLNSESNLPTIKVKTLAVTIRNNLEDEGTEV